MQPEYGDIVRHDTFPKLLLHNAARWPGEIAMREKEFGIWNEFTWADCRDRVREIALGLDPHPKAAADRITFGGDGREPPVDRRPCMGHAGRGAQALIRNCAYGRKHILDPVVQLGVASQFSTRRAPSRRRTSRRTTP